MRFGAAWVAALSIGCAACAPTLDWREVRLAEDSASVLLPCKPTARTRTVKLGAVSAKMQLHACSAGGVTWAVAHADLVDPALVGPALAELRDAFARNLGASSRSAMLWQVPGMTPSDQAQRLRLDGTLPRSEAVQAEAGFFAKGTRIFQTTAIGPHLDEASLGTYFAGIRLR